MKLSRSVVFPAAAVLCAACDTAAPQAAAHVTRDSAGIQIIESNAPMWSSAEGTATNAAWQLSSEPVLEIGEEDGAPELLFSRVVGAIRLDDGTTIVADRQSNQIRFFDREGNFLRAIGGTGGGPGEYENLRALRRWSQDSLIAFDISWQAKIYDLSGKLQREMVMRDSGPFGIPYMLSTSRTGDFVINGWGQETLPPTIGFYRTTSTASVLGSDGQLVSKLGEFPGSDRVGTRNGSRPHPFGRSTVLAIGRTKVYVGTADAFEIKSFNKDGTLNAIIRAPSDDLAFGADQQAEYRKQRLSRAAPEQHPAIEREIKDMVVPATFPAYTEMHVDAEDNLWVKRFRRPLDQSTRWAVFSPEGVLRGHLDMPADFEVTEIGADYVIGVHKDELAVERVRVYALDKAE